MKLERTKNSIRNMIWGVAQKTILTLGPFIVRTVLIHVLSAEYSGLNSLFSSILQILSLTELGFSNAIVYSMYKPVAEDDKEKVCALLNIYKKAYRYIGLVILTVGAAISPLLPKLINGTVPSDINLYILYYIYLFNTVISYFLFAYKTSLLSAYQREDIVSRNTLGVNILLYILQIISLHAFHNYYYYVIFIPVTTIILNLFNNRAVDQLFPDYKATGTISNEEREVLKKNLAGLMIGKIGGATRNTFDSIVISAYLGLTVVAMYNNYFYILNGVNTIIGVISTSITAGVGNKMASASKKENYQDFRKLHFMYMWIASWCTVCMLCLYQPFMKIWMGKDLMFPTTIVPLFCYYFFMMKQGDINSVYYQAAGLWWYGRWRSLIEATMNLTLNLILGYYYGVVGILLATIISFSVICVYGSGIIYWQYFKEEKYWDFWKTNLKFVFTTAITGVATYFICKKINLLFSTNEWINLIINLLICIVIPNLIFLLILKSDEEFNPAIEFMKSMLKKIKNDLRSTLSIID